MSGEHQTVTGYRIYWDRPLQGRRHPHLHCHKEGMTLWTEIPLSLVGLHPSDDEQLYRDVELLLLHSQIIKTGEWRFHPTVGECEPTFDTMQVGEWRNGTIVIPVVSRNGFGTNPIHDMNRPLSPYGLDADRLVGLLRELGMTNADATEAEYAARLLADEEILRMVAQRYIEQETRRMNARAKLAALFERVSETGGVPFVMG